MQINENENVSAITENELIALLICSFKLLKSRTKKKIREKKMLNMFA